MTARLQFQSSKLFCQFAAVWKHLQIGLFQHNKGLDSGWNDVCVCVCVFVRVPLRHLPMEQ